MTTTAIEATPAFVWRDGRLVPWAEATVHAMAHVVSYGSSVIEGIRSYRTAIGGAIFRLEDHLRRLLESARIYRLPVPHSLHTLTAGCVETVAANGSADLYLRPIVARTRPQLRIVENGGSSETFIIPWPLGTLLGTDALMHGVDVQVSSWRRPAAATFPAMAKAGGNYLNGQLAAAEARGGGFAEAILLDVSGHVSEGSGQNLFLVRNERLYTPPLSSGILAGITRDTVLQIAADMGIPCVEQTIPREMLHLAEEIFLTGTASEITPVRSVDRIPVGRGEPGVITMALQRRYLAVVRGAVPDRHHWLTPVVLAD